MIYIVLITGFSFSTLFPNNSRIGYSIQSNGIIHGWEIAHSKCTLRST